MNTIFSGSYDPQDVHFLLKPVHMDYIPVPEKEARIQSGQNHYSEMLSAEHLPSAAYYQLFEEAMQRNAHMFAHHIWLLAQGIAHKKPDGSLTLVSLARAGTPVGVLLRRSLALMGREVRHYSISIIRDRGLDHVALRHIIEKEGCCPHSVIFVDGWTGKGVIGAELRKAVSHFRTSTGHALCPDLHVVADLCGVAQMSATGEDYLIPSSLLNAVISGLVSRSVLNAAVVGPKDFHACVYHKEWLEEDRSRLFVDQIFQHIKQIRQTLQSRQDTSVQAQPCYTATADELAQRQRRSAAFLDYCRQEFGVHNSNHVKPGIGEATRVLLRRVPHLVLLRHDDQADTQHIALLAKEKSVPLRILPQLPYAAAALIRQL